jgi:hypothetical protein
MMSDPEDCDSLKLRLIKETAVIRWQELQGVFARGMILVAGNDLDLVETALQIARDNKTAVESWSASGQLAKATDQQAQQWYEGDASLWAVVVKPWVIVQAHSD